MRMARPPRARTRSARATRASTSMGEVRLSMGGGEEDRRCRGNGLCGPCHELAGAKRRMTPLGKRLCLAGSANTWRGNPPDQQNCSGDEQSYAQLPWRAPLAQGALSRLHSLPTTHRSTHTHTDRGGAGWAHHHWDLSAIRVARPSSPSPSASFNSMGSSKNLLMLTSSLRPCGWGGGRESTRTQAESRDSHHRIRIMANQEHVRPPHEHARRGRTGEDTPCGDGS